MKYELVESTVLNEETGRREYRPWICLPINTISLEELRGGLERTHRLLKECKEVESSLKKTDKELERAETFADEYRQFNKLQFKQIFYIV